MSRRTGLVLDQPPARLYEMKRKHVEKYWLCVKLVPKAEFAHLSDDELTTEHCDFAYCELCKITIYCVKGNNEVGQHMETKHQAKMEEYEAAKADEQERKRLRLDIEKGRTNTNAITVASASDQEYANHLLTKWIAESMRPLTLVEDAGFIAYVNYVTAEIGRVKVAIPLRTELRALITSMAVAKRKVLAERISEECTYYSLTTDLWTDRGMRSFMACTIHYADVQFNIHAWALGIQSFPGRHTATKITDALGKTMEAWGLDKSRCSMLLRDGAANAVRAAMDLGVPNISCIAHCLHLVVSAAMMRKPKRKRGASSVPSADGAAILNSDEEPCDTDDEDDEEVVVQESHEGQEGQEEADIAERREEACQYIQDVVTGEITSETDQQCLNEMRGIVAKFRKIATYFQRSSKGTTELATHQTNPKKVLLDCPTRWDSTFVMLARFQELQTPLRSFFDHIGGVGKADFADVKIRRPLISDWFAVKCLCVLLEGFSVISTRLGGETYPTMVKVFPYLRLLKEDLQNGDIFDDCIAQAREEGHQALAETIMMMHGVRRALLEIFSRRFAGMNVNLLWVPLLDPRQARTKGYLKPSEVDDAKLLLTDALIEMQHQRPASPEPNTPPTFLSPIRTRQEVIDRYEARLYGIEPRSERAAVPSVDIRAACEAEVASFFVMSLTALASVTPETWWRANGSQLPLMNELARKWLGCIATSVPSERVFSTSGSIVSIRRCALTPGLVEDLVFLAHNA